MDQEHKVRKMLIISLDEIEGEILNVDKILNLSGYKVKYGLQI